MPDTNQQALAVEAVAETLGISDEWSTVLDVPPGSVLTVEQVQYLVRVTHVRSYLETVDRAMLGMETKVSLVDAARVADEARRESESQQPLLPEPVGPADRQRAAAFLAAVRNCIYDEHQAGCSFGGMSVGSLYWLVAEGCELPHGDTCAWCDAEATTAFAGREPGHSDDNHRFLVPACGPCAEEWVRIDPRWKQD